MQTLLDDPDFVQHSEELLEFYRQYPEIAALDLLRVELSPIQKVVLRSMWFRDYVMAIMCRGSGKCVGKDSYIFTSAGLFKIRDLMQKTEILKEANFTVSDGTSLAPAQKIYYDGIKPINILSTNFGYSINVTDEHPLLVMSDDGNLRWKKGCEIREGDYVCVSRGDNVWGEINADTNLAYYLGLLIGDGCLTRENIISFSSEDDQLLNIFVELTGELLNYNAKIRKPKNRCREVRIYSIKIRKYLESLGLGYGSSSEKQYPSYLLNKDRDSVVSFLQGLFDTDGTVSKSHLEVSYCTSSKELAHVVHLLLLNLGIISKKRFKYNNKQGAYILDITGKDASIFSNTVGFRLERKKNLLKKKIKSNKFNTNKNIIPNQKVRFSRIFKNSKLSDSRELRQRVHKYANYYDISYDGLSNILNDLNLQDTDTQYLSALHKTNHFFDKIVSKSFASEEVYDLCIPEENQHAFVANGFVNHNTFINAVFACLKAMLYPGHRVGLLAPTFRQSKFMFDEVDKLYKRSPILQSACEKQPTKASDNCYLTFKSVGTKNSSVIQAIPLGDGTKIRGSRFYTILCDEFPHIPEEIFNMVIRPMTATVAEPMENVRRLARQKDMLAKGLMTQEEIDDAAVTNQIIITSSGYFTFNHMYKLYCAYKDEMKRGNDKYAVYRVPYTLLPEGFLDQKSIEAAQREMSSLEFRMEYEAAFIPDTDAFYRASLLEGCSHTGFSTRVAGEPGKSYCLGVDPARNEDSFAICVAELGVPSKIVHAVEIQNMPFPKMAEVLEDLCDAFNVQAIYMDAGGGGLAIKDILAENNRGHRAGPLLDPHDEVHHMKSGRHILTMCNFGTDFISESNFDALRLLEHRDLLFPSIPCDVAPTPAQEESWQTVQIMKQQMQMIELTETPTGKQHFDVPKGEGHGKQKKDLYTAFMLAARCVYDNLWAEMLPESVIYHGGVIIPRETQTEIFSGGIPVESVYGSLRDKLEIAQNPMEYRHRLLTQALQGRKVLTSPAAVLKPVPKGKAPGRTSNRPVNKK